MTATNVMLADQQSNSLSKEIKLQIESDVKNYFLYNKLNGLSDPQKQQFMSLCLMHGLNPLKKEIYASTYGNKFDIIVGYEVYLKKTEEHPQFDGFKVSIEQEGNNTYAVCQVWRKDRSRPTVAKVKMSEYKKSYGVWKSSPEVMLEKVAISRCFRWAFPNMLDSSIYTREEMDVQEVAEVITQPVSDSSPTAIQNHSETKIIEPSPISDSERVKNGKDRINEIVDSNHDKFTPKELKEVSEEINTDKLESIIGLYNYVLEISKRESEPVQENQADEAPDQAQEYQMEIARNRWNFEKKTVGVEISRKLNHENYKLADNIKQACAECEDVEQLNAVTPQLEKLVESANKKHKQEKSTDLKGEYEKLRKDYKGYYDKDQAGIVNYNLSNGQIEYPEALEELEKLILTYCTEECKAVHKFMGGDNSIELEKYKSGRYKAMSLSNCIAVTEDFREAGYKLNAYIEEEEGKKQVFESMPAELPF